MHTRLLNRLSQYLALEPIPAGQRERVTRTFYILLRIVLVGISAQVMIVIINPGLIGQLAVSLLSLLLLLTAHGLMQRGHVQAAAGLLVTLIWLHVTLASYLDAGLYSATTIAYSITVLIAGIMLGGRAALGYGLLTMLSLTGMYLGWEAGWIRAGTDYFDFTLSLWLTHTLVVIISGTLIWLASDMLNRVFTQLDERNRALEREIEERQLLESQRTELLIARDRAEFLSQFLGEIGEITHDLKGPLSVINTSLYFLERPLDIEAKQQRIQRIQEQTEVMQNYIQNILTISRLEHEVELNWQPADLNHLVMSAAETFRGSVAAKQLTLHVDTAEQPCIVEVDVAQINRAISNLIENAVLYTPSGGSITLHTCLDETGVKLSVCDTGIGIAEEEQERIFERFYRGKQIRMTQQNGSGLGLAIVRKIVELHGGQVEVTSSSGQGSTFVVWLPWASAQTK